MPGVESPPRPLRPAGLDIESTPPTDVTAVTGTVPLPNPVSMSAPRHTLTLQDPAPAAGETAVLRSNCGQARDVKALSGVTSSRGRRRTMDARAATYGEFVSDFMPPFFFDFELPGEWYSKMTSEQPA